jgi:hypothetical protein
MGGANGDRIVTNEEIEITGPCGKQASAKCTRSIAGSSLGKTFLA